MTDPSHFRCGSFLKNILRLESRASRVMVGVQPSSSRTPLPAIKLHYDGWLMLSAEHRALLNIVSGDLLSADLIDGVIVLRSLRLPGHASTEHSNGSTAVEAIAPKRGRGRPRKVDALLLPVHSSSAASGAIVPKRGRGRPRKSDAFAVAQRSRSAVAGVGEARLIRKADLRPEVEGARALPAAAEQPTFALIANDGGVAERHPFRNVETRKRGKRALPEKR